MRIFSCSALILMVVASTGACDPPSGDGPSPDAANGVELDECAPVGGHVRASGEMEGAFGPVTVEVSESEGRVSLSITPMDHDDLHTASFDLAGAPLDDIVGTVTMEVGSVFVGEGSEYGYLRLTDERGVFFEGGHSGFIDNYAQGGGVLEGPFVLGDATGDACRSRGLGYDVELHDVHAALGDGGEPMRLDARGRNGTWRGVPVRAVGVHAQRGIYNEPVGTEDGFGWGEHELVHVIGYLYRVAP